MRIALGESDRKRAAASSPNASPAAARSRPRRPDSLLSLSSSKLSDKENCVGGGPPRTRASPFHRPNDEFVCVELPVDQSYANKRLRGIASSEVSSKARSQAPRKSRHNYLKPGTLAKVRDAAHKAGRKRVAEGDGIHAAERSTRFFDGGVRHASASPERVPHAGIAPRWLGPACLQRKKLLAPKFLALPPLQPAAANEAVPMVVEEVPAPAPAARSSNEEQSRDAGTGTAQPSSSSSSLETLPPELLVRIVCRLDHNQLKPVFHVCRSLRQAVMIAKQCHFNFTTPGKDHKTVSDAKLGQAFSSPPFFLQRIRSCWHLYDAKRSKACREIPQAEVLHGRHEANRCHALPRLAVPTASSERKGPDDASGGIAQGALQRGRAVQGHRPEHALRKFFLSGLYNIILWIEFNSC